MEQRRLELYCPSFLQVKLAGVADAYCFGATFGISSCNTDVTELVRTRAREDDEESKVVGGQLVMATGNCQFTRAEDNELQAVEAGGLCWCVCV